MGGDRERRALEAIGIIFALLGQTNAFPPVSDNVVLFTEVVTEFEKHAWFLRASLES